MSRERAAASAELSGSAPHLHQHACTCGNFQKSLASTSDANSGFASHGTPLGLEASFVHLALPPLTGARYSSSPWIESRDTGNDSHVFLETLRHSSALLRTANGNAQGQDTNDPGVSLCQDCIDRIAATLDADTERINEESNAYLRAVTAEEERQNLLGKALLANNFPPAPSEEQHGSDLMERTADAFREEIEVLKAACEQHENELKHLQSLQKEQAFISKQLDHVEEGLWEDRNSLELEARAFDHVQTQLTSHVTRAQQEVEALSRVRLHSSLFDLAVDKRGLRYPLINELRLAYRPKGDVRWSEINAAWSQAAQLLLFVGASVKFRPRDWRIVPLTSCAKLICLSPDGKHRAVYNLGGREVEAHGSTTSTDHGRDDSMGMSLRALNALLDQMIRHVISMVEHPPQLPFDTTRQRIGSYDLSHLEESNDSGWSRVIHCMACNLQWLSDRASEVILQEDII